MVEFWVPHKGSAELMFDEGVPFTTCCNKVLTEVML